MKYWIWSILCCATSVCAGQLAHMQADVEKRFHADDSIHWTTIYSGRWNDFHQTEVILSHNGNAYHGAITYVSSGQTFELEGQIQQDGRSILFESNPTGRITALMDVFITDTRIQGQWINQANDRIYPFTAIASSVIPLKKFEPKVITYMSSDRRSSLVIMKEAPEQLSGHLHLKGQPLALSFAGTCQDIRCKYWVAEAYNETGIVGTIEVKKSTDFSLTFKFEEPMGDKISYSLSKIHEIPISVDGYAHFSGSIDYAVADFEHETFNTWLQNQLKDWWEQAIEILKDADPNEMLTSERQKQAWNAWMEIGYVSKKGATGILTMTNPDNTISRPFALDLKKKEMISLASLFKKGVDVSKLCLEFTEKYRDDLITESEVVYDEWIRQVKFHNIYFRPDGMVLKTDYDPVFGSAEIVIPYNEIKSDLRKKSVIGELID